MIKTVKLIKTIKDKYFLPVEVFELSVPAKVENHVMQADFLTGGFYNKIGYPMVALYVSDKDGNILDTQPFIQEDGIPYYTELFERYGYTLI